jgi:hypothetical protein
LAREDPGRIVPAKKLRVKRRTLRVAFPTPSGPLI